MPLPQPFDDLIPLYHRWASGDDMEQALRIADASDDDLRSLVDGLQPWIVAITEYLDRLDLEPLPASAQNLARMVELAAESARELGLRHADDA